MLGALVRSVLLSALLIAALLLSGCSQRGDVQVVERVTINERLETEKIGGRLIRYVQPGDTLYSIAFENNVDVNQLAQWNGIRDIGRLPTGKKLRLTKPIGFKPPQTIKPKAPIRAERSSERKHSKANVGAGKTVETQSSIHKKNTTAKQLESWGWPVTGRVIESFSLPKGRQGVVISERLAKPVLSSKSGEVVYVGNALKGYGNLIIVKHDEHFLSAYAHNQATFVIEGQAIKAGEQIGSGGYDNQRRLALHFQIRKNGKPVNPLSYLPKR